jgi:transposase
MLAFLEWAPTTPLPYFTSLREEWNLQTLYRSLEGHRCTIATYGYSRDKRKDKVQIVIRLVTTYDEFPIQCKIYPGNTKDETTVSAVIEELTQQYPIQDIVFVGNRGMLTASNVKTMQRND